MLGCVRTTAAMRISRARRRLLARLGTQDDGQEFAREGIEVNDPRGVH